MDSFRIIGGRELHGEVSVSGAKNAVLPMLAAAMLTDDPVTLTGCPDLRDVRNMLAILRTLGCRAEFDRGDIRVDASTADRWEMPEALSKELRSSFFLLGPLIGRFRRARVTYPGGCDIGLRPIDLHLKGLRALGVAVREAHGEILCDGAGLRGGTVHLDFPSVGATENVMLAAVLARGTTVIHNAAREPEIRDLQDLVNALGGRVKGGGSDTVVVEGVKRLHGGTYRPMADRIVAGTLLTACAAAGGDLCLANAPVEALGAVLDKLRRCGCQLETGPRQVAIRVQGRLRSFELSTQPYPGFPTDMQAQFMALACLLDGTSVIVENVFENRFHQAAELRRMGADIYVNGRLAVVRGGRLTGARVRAGDLRGGAALVIAALAAEGETSVENVRLIDRGYEAFEQTLSRLGADITRVHNGRKCDAEGKNKQG